MSLQDKFENMSEIHEYLKVKYLDQTKEMFGVMSFDSGGRFINFEFLSSGDVAAVGISSRMVMEKVINNKATSVILVHNHPGGNALPSEDDLTATKMIANALRSINVYLLDHLILCDGDYVSLAQIRDYKHIFNR